MARARPGKRLKTAKELLDELARSAPARARAARAEERSRRSALAYQQAARPLLDELARAGIRLNRIAQLRHDVKVCRAAAPMLVNALERVTYLPLKEDIVRTLGLVRGDDSVIQALVREFREAGDPVFRWAIGSSIELVADERHFDAVADLARDSRGGMGRQMLAVALGKMRSRAADAVLVLVAMLDDPTVQDHAAKALAMCGHPSARPHLERLRDHPRAWVRAAVQKALAN